MTTAGKSLVIASTGTSFGQYSHARTLGSLLPGQLTTFAITHSGASALPAGTYTAHAMATAGKTLVSADTDAQFGYWNRQATVVGILTGTSWSGSFTVSGQAAGSWSGTLLPALHFAAAGVAGVSLVGTKVWIGSLEASGDGAIAELDAGASLTGILAAAGSSGLSFVAGQFGFRFIPRRPGRWEKPPLGAQIDWGAPLAKDLRIAALINEGGGVNFWNTAQAAPVICNTGFDPRRGADGFGPWICNQYNYDGWLFGTGASLVCPGAVSAAVMCGIPNYFGWFPLLFARGTITGANTWPQVATGDWGIYAARTPNPYNVPFMGIWVNTAAGYQYLTFAPPASPALVGFTYDGARLIAYVNGQPVASSTINSALVTGSYQIRLGGEEGYANQCWSGNLYAAYLWGRALSASEMQQLWERPYTSVTVPIRRWIAIPAVAGSQWFGNFRSAGAGSALWQGYSAFASTAMQALGSAAAEWLGSVQERGGFTADGRGSAAWDVVPYLSGKFECDGEGAAEFLGSLDAQAYTCLTAGDGTPGAAGQNFVF